MCLNNGNWEYVHRVRSEPFDPTAFRVRNGRITVSELSKFAAVNARLNGLQTQITNSLTLIANNTADIEAANEQISATQSDLLTLTSRVDKLEAANKIWRANFQIVNTTFA